MPRVAAVTGGASGIGLAIAERLLADGFEVVVGDMDEVAGGALSDRLPIRFVPLDASDENSMRDFISACGDVHALVHNVGIRGATGDIWNIGTDQFRETFDANVWSHLLASRPDVHDGHRATSRHSGAETAASAVKGGKIVTSAETLAFSAQFAMCSAYEQAWASVLFIFHEVPSHDTRTRSRTAVICVQPHSP